MAFARQLNLDRRHDAACYGHGQLSLRYLQGVISGNSERSAILCPASDLTQSGLWKLKSYDKIVMQSEDLETQESL